METAIIVVGLFVALAVITGVSPLGRKGRDKWEAHHGRGESMLEDFDKEQNDINNLMR